MSRKPGVNYLCDPARYYLIIMIAMYLVLAVASVMHKSQTTDDIKEYLFSSAGISIYVLKMLLWVLILNVLCKFNCKCMANIVLFFGVLLFITAVLFFIHIALNPKDADATWKGTFTLNDRQKNDNDNEQFTNKEPYLCNRHRNVFI